MSTWLPGIATPDIGGTTMSEKRPKDLPVFLAHGLADPVLPIDFGRDARRRIEALCRRADLKYAIALAGGPDNGPGVVEGRRQRRLERSRP